MSEQTAFAKVKESALSAEAREVLGMASHTWRRLPMRHAAVVSELELCGFVETETRWQWSARDSGAGSHVVMWKRKA